MRYKMPALILLGLLFAVFPACGGDGGSPADQPGDDDAGEPSDDDATPPDDDSGDDDTADDDTTDDDTGDDDTAPCPDEDGDGFTDKACGGRDCDDGDAEVHPDAVEVCGDHVDNDCDGEADNPFNPPVNLPEFILGISSRGDYLNYLPELGLRWIRPTISWKSVMPQVPDEDLSLQEVLDNPGMIDDFLDNGNWAASDERLGVWADAGLQLFPIVGHGFGSTHSMIDGERASPDRIGRDTYLAYMYLHVRAIVERYDGDGYKDAPGIVIKLWQTENELNQALLTAAWGWREPQWLDALGSAWADWDFTTRLLEVLYQAVHDADPEAITTQNLHTDIHPNLSRLIFQPSWQEAATLWRDAMDLIGFDAYVNYYVAEPVMGDEVGDRVRILQEASCGKPIIGMELGYPTGPEELGFSWANQARYIDDAFHSAFDAGIVGYMHFGLNSGDTHNVEITPEDRANLELIIPWFQDGRVLPMLGWALQNLDYINGHFLDVVKSVEGYWGVIGPEGVRKDGYYILQAIAEEVN